MKKICFLLALCLLLTGCTVSAATEEPTETTEVPPTETETVPEPTEAPDAGIASVVIQAPRSLEVHAEEPDVIFTVSFTGIDPTGAPEEGRLCTLSLLQDGELLMEDALLLEEEETVSFCVSYAFSRYMEQTESTVTLRLSYGEQTLEKNIPVTLINAPDEFYAAKSDDPLPYSIDVLRNQNVVVVYGKDEEGEYTVPIHVFLCSTGTSTPVGYFKLGGRHEWISLFHGVYGHYAIGVYGDILFHSVPYRKAQSDTLETEEFNKLGTKASMGCIRMQTSDVKWLYDNCPAGTSVHFYDVETLEFEKPEALQLDPEDPRSCWDPTDPDAENPWNQPDPLPPAEEETR